MFNTLAVLFLPIILGYLLKYFKYLDKNINAELKLFVMRVTVPCTIFTAMYNLELETIKQIIPVSGAFIFLTAIQIIITFFILRIKDKKTKATFMLTAAFGNYGYVGWAVLENAIGHEGLTRGMFFNALWWPVIYLSTFIIGKLNNLTGKLDIKKYRVNILVPSVVLVLGILFNYLNLQIYTPLNIVLENFGEMTSPLILFSVGLSISIDESIKKLKTALVPVILRPMLGFLVALIIVKIINFSDPISRTSVLLESTMPVGVTTVILGEMIGLDENLLSSIMVLSTLFSLLTIPLTMLILEL